MRNTIAPADMTGTAPNWYLAEIANCVRTPSLLAIAVAVCLLHLAYYLLWSYQLNLFGKMTQEDGLLEYGTALLLLIAGGGFLIGARLSTSRIQKTWSVLFAVAFVFMAGEEISWGQRIFGFNVESLEQINVQQEANLHNLPFIDAPRLLSIGSLMCGVVLPVVLMFSGTMRHFMVNVLSLPVPHPVASLCFLLSYGWYRFFYLGAPNSVGALSVEESREFSIGVACLIYAGIWLMSRHVDTPFSVMSERRTDDIAEMGA